MVSGPDRQGHVDLYKHLCKSMGRGADKMDHAGNCGLELPCYGGREIPI